MQVEQTEKPDISAKSSLEGLKPVLHRLQTVFLEEAQAHVYAAVSLLVKAQWLDHEDSREALLSSRSPPTFGIAR